MRKGLTKNIDAIIEKVAAKEGLDISKGIEAATRYSQHKLNSKNIVMMLLSDRFISDENFEHLESKYKVSKEEIRLYILQKLKNGTLV